MFFPHVKRSGEGFVNFLWPCLPFHCKNLVHPSEEMPAAHRKYTYFRSPNSISEDVFSDTAEEKKKNEFAVHKK